MFSRAERAYLRLLADGPEESARERVASAFPNPAYRRKLMWGIRQKAARALSDWALYAEASRRESRVIPPLDPDEVGRPPVFSEPFARWFEGVRDAVLPRRKAGRTGADEPVARGR